jgi:hypothetical protein
MPHCGNFANNFLITTCKAESSFQHSCKKSKPVFCPEFAATLSFCIRSDAYLTSRQSPHATIFWDKDQPYAIAKNDIVVPTVINPLLKQIGVEKQVSTLLEGKGIFIDSIGAILAVIMLHFVLSGNVEPLILIKGLVLRLGLGIIIGLGEGWSLSQLLKQDRFLSQELKNLAFNCYRVTDKFVGVFSNFRCIGESWFFLKKTTTSHYHSHDYQEN